MKEFHVTKQARDKYQFEEVLFSKNGNIVFANFHASREFAHKINQLRTDTADFDTLASPADMGLFEYHDAFSIMAALSLEAAGFCEPGQGPRLAIENKISFDGELPVATMGGLKARGHPVGATGVYQLVEATLQLRQLAGPTQVQRPKYAMTQNIGGSGSNITTHILQAE